MIRYFAAAMILVLTVGCNKAGAPEDAQRNRPGSDRA
jgi:hypothetical protein